MWTGALKDRGTKFRWDTKHGKFRFNGRFVCAHRLAYKWFVDNVDAGQNVQHKCVKTSRGACVNPHHLFVKQAPGKRASQMSLSDSMDSSRQLTAASETGQRKPELSVSIPAFEEGAAALSSEQSLFSLSALATLRMEHLVWRRTKTKAAGEEEEGVGIGGGGGGGVEGMRRNEANANTNLTFGEVMEVPLSGPNIPRTLLTTKASDAEVQMPSMLFQATPTSSLLLQCSSPLQSSAFSQSRGEKGQDKDKDKEKDKRKGIDTGKTSSSISSVLSAASQDLLLLSEQQQC
jgi:hypothetical protein